MRAVSSCWRNTCFSRTEHWITLPILAEFHGGQLEEVPAQNKLYAAKWPPVVPGPRCDKGELVRKGSRYHGYLVDDQHVHLPPPRLVYLFPIMRLARLAVLPFPAPIPPKLWIVMPTARTSQSLLVGLQQRRKDVQHAAPLQTGEEGGVAGQHQFHDVGLIAIQGGSHLRRKGEGDRRRIGEQV